MDDFSKQHLPGSMIRQAYKLPQAALLYEHQTLMTQATLHHHSAVCASFDADYYEMPCTMSASAIISESTKLTKLT